ncbi:ABC transporter permease [Acutalibacter caecimuris]|uniref:ABC transporter permease n=1 Tax=Acutalibacter caecimuris TaxID=3093657 RepID=UPI002AC982BD|nr:ABC transporter permease subunit [Acutalibacter sp. M00118]
MRKLLSANFFALSHSKRFWLGGAVLVVAAALDVLGLYKMQAHGEAVSLDNTIVSCAPWQFILLPCLCGLFINTDYNDGTIRNKLAVGHSRTAVYMSNFITVYAMELFYMALALSTIFLVGIGLPVDEPGHVAQGLGVLLLSILALTAISVFLATLIANRSALVVCAMVGLALMFGGQIINGILENPKMVADYGGVVFVTDEEGEQKMQYLDREGNPIDAEDIPMVRNPHYVEEPQRTMLRQFNEMHPGGQLWEIMWNGHREYNEDGSEAIVVQTPRWLLATYALAVTALFTGAGILLFRRKDLK